VERMKNEKFTMWNKAKLFNRVKSERERVKGERDKRTVNLKSGIYDLK
jgi:hypothetical protein